MDIVGRRTAGALIGTFTISVLTDTLFENTETIVAAISNLSNPAVYFATSSATAHIADNNNAAQSIAANLSVLTDGNEAGPVNVAYKVTLATVNNTGLPISFQLNPSGGTASSGLDYTSFTDATISVPSGSNTGTYNVGIVDDTLFENSETLQATLSNPSDAAIILGTTNATANIADNDNAVGSVNASLSVETNGHETGPVDIVYKVTLGKTNDTGSDIHFDIAPTAGSSTVDADYVNFAAGVIKVPNGATSGTLSVAILDDNLFKNAETLVATISNPSDPAVNISIPSATATIFDSDNGLGTIGAALSVSINCSEVGPTSIVYKVTLGLTNHTGGNITFNLNPTCGTATAGTDYVNLLGATITVLDGSANGTYVVPVLDDALFENSETVTASLSTI